MKYFRILSILIAIELLCVSPQLFANVFATHIRATQPGSSAPFDGIFTDGSGIAIRFVLSDHADSVVAVIKDGITVVRTFTTTNLSMGDAFVVWDGKNNAGVFVSAGTYNYSVSLTTYDKGYASYTALLADIPATGLSQRGMTTINNPALKSFGSIYDIDNAGFQGAVGITRFASSLLPWGNVKDSAQLTSTGITTGSNDLRWGVQSDEDGYIYAMARAGSATAPKGVYRFHADSLNVVMVDSAYGSYFPFGVAVRKDAVGKTFAVTTLGAASSTMSGDSRILTYHVNNNAPYFGAKDTLLKGNGKVIYWDIVWGRDSTFYVPIMFPGDTIKGGVAKFDLHGKTLPLTLADTVWTARVDTGRPTTVSLFMGTAVDGSKDVLYLENSKTATGMVGQGVWGFTGLNTSHPTRVSVYAGTASSTTRTDISVDAVGNVVYFENSNETMSLISPPTGPNNYTTNSAFSIRVLNAIPIIAAVRDANGDFKPDSLGKTVTVVGIVNSRNTQTVNTAYTLQDDSAGIMYFSFGLGGPSPKIGQKIKVTGAVAQNRGTTEVIPVAFTDVEIVDTNIQVLSPIVLTIPTYVASAEKYESRFIKLTGIAKKSNSPAWPAAGASANMMFWNGWDTLVVRLDSDTPVPGSKEPTYPVDVQGVASQFTSTAAIFNDGYQITPNDSTDFTWGVSVAPNPHFALVSPNKGSSLVLDSNAQSFKFTWKRALDLNGDALIYQWAPVGFTAVTTTSAGADSFLVRTGVQLRALMAGKDTTLLKWFVKTKDPSNPIVNSIDTFAVTLIKGKITGVDATDMLPIVFSLDQNYPNPFNPSTTIKYSIPTDERVSLKIYNMLGQEVATVVNETMNAGRYTATFNASRLSSGVYIYRIQAGSFVSVKKMMLLK